MSKCATCNVERAEVIAEHYQKTFELNHDLWRERNKYFIFLLLISAVTILVAYRTAGVLLVMTDVYNKLLGGSHDVTSNHGFPFDPLQSILLAVILYLMIQIYHRTIHINRTYSYLENLEETIRVQLALEDETFTREGKFYSKNPDWLLKQTGLAYALILGVLLFLVAFGNRVLANASSSQKSLFDLALLLIIAIYYFKYFATTSRMKKLIVWIKRNTPLAIAVLLFGLIYGVAAMVTVQVIGAGWVRPAWGKFALQVLLFWFAFVVLLGLWVNARKQTAKPARDKAVAVYLALTSLPIQLL